MKNKITKYMTALFFVLSACSSAGSGSNNELRTITGQLDGGASAYHSTWILRNALASGEGCEADTLIATDTSGNTTVNNIDDTCGFAIDLEIGKSYILSFTLDDSFVATLLFDTGVSGFTGSTLNLSAGDSDIELGLITINGSIASPENNPLSYLDKDDDGENDLLDADDDDDGVEDAAESDCDLDGVIDDDDASEDDNACGNVADTGVTRVKPYANETDVDLDREIKIYTSCVVDPASVNSTSFAVTDADGVAISCTYEFSDDDLGSTIKCKHEDSPLSNESVYTATISGLLCEDGAELDPVTWIFTTESEDNDVGAVEDDFDEEDAVEGEDTEDHLEDGDDDSGDDTGDDSGDDGESDGSNDDGAEGVDA